MAYFADPADDAAIDAARLSAAQANERAAEANEAAARQQLNEDTADSLQEILGV